MILRRLTENLRAQNWTAIGIEFLIVVIGVFIGTQVSNWNEERIERRETERMLEHSAPSCRPRSSSSTRHGLILRRAVATPTRRSPHGRATKASATNSSSLPLTRRARFSASASILKIGR